MSAASRVVMAPSADQYDIVDVARPGACLIGLRYRETGESAEPILGMKRSASSTPPVSNSANHP
jgi:hypothetical protein